MPTNPLLWWTEPAAAVFERTAEYYGEMAKVHKGTPLAPAFALGAMTYTATAEGLTTMAESADRPQIPKYSVETGGVVCRPAAWN